MSDEPKHPLKLYREREGLSQEALGKRLGVTGMTVYRWEKGERIPRRRDWPKISDKTGVQPREFLEFARVAV